MQQNLSDMTSAINDMFAESESGQGYIRILDSVNNTHPVFAPILEAIKDANFVFATKLLALDMGIRDNISINLGHLTPRLVNISTDDKVTHFVEMVDACLDNIRPYTQNLSDNPAIVGAINTINGEELGYMISDVSQLFENLSKSLESRKVSALNPKKDPNKRFSAIELSPTDLVILGALPNRVKESISDVYGISNYQKGAEWRGPTVNNKGGSSFSYASSNQMIQTFYKYITFFAIKPVIQKQMPFSKDLCHVFTLPKLILTNGNIVKFITLTPESMVVDAGKLNLDSPAFDITVLFTDMKEMATKVEYIHLHPIQINVIDLAKQEDRFLFESCLRNGYLAIDAEIEKLAIREFLKLTKNPLVICSNKQNFAGGLGGPSDKNPNILKPSGKDIDGRQNGSMSEDDWMNSLAAINVTEDGMNITHAVMHTLAIGPICSYMKEEGFFAPHLDTNVGKTGTYGNARTNQYNSMPNVEPFTTIDPYLQGGGGYGFDNNSSADWQLYKEMISASSPFTSDFNLEIAMYDKYWIKLKGLNPIKIIPYNQMKIYNTKDDYTVVNNEIAIGKVAAVTGLCATDIWLVDKSRTFSLIVSETSYHQVIRTNVSDTLKVGLEKVYMFIPKNKAKIAMFEAIAIAPDRGRRVLIVNATP